MDGGFETPFISAQSTNKLYLLNNLMHVNIYVFCNFGISHVFLVIHSLTPYGTFCLLALMIAINVSVAMCQLPVHQFSSFGKMSNPYEIKSRKIQYFPLVFGMT